MVCDLRKDGLLTSLFTGKLNFGEVWEAVRYDRWRKIMGRRELPNDILEKVL